MFEFYGRIQLLSNEHVDAGRYLYLSGARSPEYEESIALYLRRHGSTWQNLVGTFPYAARRPLLSEFPTVVAEHLRDLGAPAKFKNYWEGGYVRPYESNSKALARDSLGCGVAIAILAFLLTTIVIGFAESVSLSFDAVHWGVWVAIALVVAAWYAISQGRR
jgi:hypothetical protein